MDRSNDSPSALPSLRQLQYLATLAERKNVLSAVWYLAAYLAFMTYRTHSLVSPGAS